MAYHNAHAARVNESNVVEEVIVIPYMNDDDEKVTAYCNGIGLQGTWLDCSYTGSRRNRYPGPGDFYDPIRDVFVPASFILVNDEWVAPPFSLLATGSSEVEEPAP